MFGSIFIVASTVFLAVSIHLLCSIGREVSGVIVRFLARRRNWLEARCMFERRAMESRGINLNMSRTVQETPNEENLVLSPDSQVPIGGPLGQYGIQPMTYPLVPPSLIFGTSLDGAISRDTLPGEEDVLPSVRRRGSGSRSSGPTARRGSSQADVPSALPSGTRSRFQWEDWMVTALCECKRMQKDHSELNAGRSQIVSADAKWKQIAHMISHKNVYATPDQLKNKWESVIGNYKLLKDHQKLSGNPEYSSMSKDERKEAKLPLVFLNQWIEILDSFYGRTSSIKPPCIAEAFDPPQSPDEPTQSSPEVHTGQELPVEDPVHSESNARSNSGK